MYISGIFRKLIANRYYSWKVAINDLKHALMHRAYKTVHDQTYP